MVPGRGRKRFRFPRPGRKTLIALLVLTGLLFVSAAGISYATYDYSKRYEGRLLPGATVAGVEVAGMTYDQALQRVEDEVDPQLERTITITWNKRTWEVTPRELGARSDAEAAVKAAMAASNETDFFDKMRMRVLGDDLDFERDVALTYSRPGARGFIQGIAAGLDKEPVNAELDYSSGWVEVAPHEDGRKVQTRKSHRRLMRAMRRGNSEIELAVRKVTPEVTSDSFGKVLLLRIGENKLYLYQNGEITHTWTVATGKPDYRTPTGLFSVTEKRFMPTWVNPDPDGWGANMPASIGPGPNNPLGLRALNWSAPLIRFHGTPAVHTLGYNASHGCVRLSNPDAIQLYDLVDVGTPIVSVEVAALRPLGGSSPDPIVVDEESGRRVGEAENGNQNGNRNRNGNQNGNGNGGD
jgi:lipoprotein-anchoring transpeptidase ErfK/SrfK